MNKYDVIIIGSGLGGLLCGNILCREGYNVCILEKNNQFGGCLQTFRRNDSIFDTGMHYFGGLDQEKFLYSFFRYYRLLDRLKIRKLDEDAYDVIRYNDREYHFSMGYQRFIDTMAHQFPHEYRSLKDYTGKLKEISRTMHPDKLLDDRSNTKYVGYYGTGYDTYLRSTFSNNLLRNVLLGMSPVYAGVRDRTPLYLPMMIHSSYIDGAYRFINGGSQLSDILVKDIRDNGGTVLNKMQVTNIRLRKSDQVKAVEVNGQEHLEGKYIIAGIHPKTMLDLIDQSAFTPAYTKRITALEETCGMFSLYLSSNSKGFQYMNRNYYCYHTDDLWDVVNYNSGNWPKGYMIHFSPVSEEHDHTNTIIVNTYMNWQEMKPWVYTMTGSRGADYEAFKKEKGQILLNILEKDFPGITRNVSSYYSSTPLTYRDYTGTYEGSAYGVLKDYRNPYAGMILPVTHIRNLFLTGQNINTHGVVGVTIGAFLTCAEILGKRYLVKKICDA